MKSSSCSIAAGMAFAVALFLIIDGFVFARRALSPYNFFMWLPTLMSLCAMFTFLFVRPEHMLRANSQDRDAEDEYDEIRIKSMIFVGTALFFGALAISVWKLTTPYIDVEAPWPGVALILHVLVLMIGNGFLMASRAGHTDEEQ